MISSSAGLPPSRRAHSAGPAPATVAGTCIRYCSKFSRNMVASFFACASYAAGSAQVPRGDSTSRGHVGHRGRHLEAEDRILHVLRPVERAGERGPDHRPGVRQLHAGAGAVGAAGPAGVHQPDPRAVLRDLLAQHLGVHARMQRQERRAEAGGEGRARLGDAALGAGDLGGVAREEVVHRLVRGEPRDRRQDAERVGGEEHDVLGMPARAGRKMVRDVVDRIAGAGVLGDLVRVEVHRAGRRIQHHVLEHGAEHLAGGVDLGLGVGPEPDDLRVAAALEVEDAAIAPAVLVVADEPAGRIGGERRLAGAREPEEDRGIARRADVGGAVHRQDALRRQQIVEHREDRLLHLARVPGPADQHQLLGEVEHDEGAGPGAVARGIGLEVGSVEDGEAGTEVGELGRQRAEEHVPHEQRVPRVRRDEPNREPVRRVRAAEEVLHEELARVEIGPHVLVQPLERRRVVPRVLLPPDAIAGALLLEQELVLGRPAGVRAT